MIWHTVTVTEGDLDQTLHRIRLMGGLVTHSFPRADGYTIMYTTVDG